MQWRIMASCMGPRTKLIFRAPYLFGNFSMKRIPRTYFAGVNRKDKKRSWNLFSFSKHRITNGNWSGVESTIIEKYLVCMSLLIIVFFTLTAIKWIPYMGKIIHVFFTTSSTQLKPLYGPGTSGIPYEVKYVKTCNWD